MNPNLSYDNSRPADRQFRGVWNATPRLKRRLNLPENEVSDSIPQGENSRQTVYSADSMNKKSILLVKPAQLHDGKPLKFSRGLTPTRALPYLAALTPSDYDVTLVDEGLEEIDFDCGAGLVGITTILSQVPRALEISDKFRAAGAKVVLGGVGASSVPDRVAGRCDSLVVGEAEGKWESVLADYQAGRLKPVYGGGTFCSVEGLPAARFDLLDRRKYIRPSEVTSSGMPRVTIETSRGCPHDCAFCSVSRYFGRTMRFRPIDDVIAEMRLYPGAHFFIVDDNVSARPSRSKELFRRMKPLGNTWIGQFSETAARDPELLDLARESGCINAFIGVESVDPEALRGAGKHANLKTDLPAVMKAFRRAGIDVNVSLIVGFDTDTRQSIQNLADYMIAQRVHLMSLFILTPLPGTRLFEQIKGEGRILHDDLSRYDGTHAVFRPKNMSAEELEETYWKTFERFYGPWSVARRFLNAPAWLRRPLPVVYTYKGNAFFRRQIRHRVHPLCGGVANGTDAAKASEGA